MQRASSRASDAVDAMLHRLHSLGVEIRTRTEVRELLEKDGKISLVPCDTVVLAIGTRAYNPLEEKVRELGIDCVAVGDAVKARQAIQAISEGFRAGLNA